MSTYPLMTEYGEDFEILGKPIINIPEVNATCAPSLNSIGSGFVFFF